MEPADADAIERLLGARPVETRPLSGGDIARSRCAVFADGTRAMAKFSGAGQHSLRLEARMLGDLAAAGLPTPQVLAVDDDLLLLQWIEQQPGGLQGEAQRAAGRAIAQLHAAPQRHRFGYGYATVIGSLHQPNPPLPRWTDFFREHRLLHRADTAVAARQLPVALRIRIDTLSSRLEEWIDEPQPALVHGDLWGGNMLAPAAGGATFVDPAIYRGDPEMDLAMACLFASVGEAFFQGYAEVRPIAPGFFEARRDLYNLYPLLVHVQLFGGRYVAAVERTLAKLGC